MKKLLIILALILVGCTDETPEREVIIHNLPKPSLIVVKFLSHSDTSERLIQDSIYLDHNENQVIWRVKDGHQIDAVQFNVKTIE